jgi:hypothetical protein
MMLVKFSAFVTSSVRPPLSACRCHSGLSVVRSGLMISQRSPRSLDRWMNWLP